MFYYNNGIAIRQQRKLHSL